MSLQLSPLDRPAPGLEVLRAPPALAPVASRVKALRHRIRFSTGMARSPVHIFASTRTIFIRIPKNASTSIIKHLYPNAASDDIPHYGADFYRTIFPNIYEKYYKFAVLRNPVTRFLSAFSYYKNASTVPAERHLMDVTLSHIKNIADFVDYLNTFDNISDAPIMAWHHFRKQKDYICDRQGRLIVDMLFTVENMAPGISELRSRVPFNGDVPQSNQSPTQEQTGIDLSRIEAYYAEDRDIWNKTLDAGVYRA